MRRCLKYKQNIFYMKRRFIIYIHISCYFFYNNGFALKIVSINILFDLNNHYYFYIDLISKSKVYLVDITIKTSSETSLMLLI